jgi:hypothetical protein
LAVQGPGKIEWGLFDMAGRQLDKGNAQAEAATMLLTLPTQELVRGTYLVRVHADGQTATRKLMVW